MELIRRKPYSNTYRISGQIHQTVLGGIPNVPRDLSGNLVPFDNDLYVVPDHPRVRYLLRQGPFSIGFHDNVANKFGVGLQLYTGERLTKRLVGDPVCQPEINKSKRFIQWSYANGAWIREYALEKAIKEVVRQKAGMPITFEYSLYGLSPKRVGNTIEFWRPNGKLAFAMRRPHRINAQGQFVEWQPIEFQNLDGKWRVTYPAPAQDVLIDPSITFGDGSGQTGGDHKDAYIWGSIGNNDNSYGGADRFYVRGLAGEVCIGLVRFSLAGHIPSGANVSAAQWHAKSVTTCTQTAYVHHLLTDWGVTPSDEGASESPATGGQATYRRSFDFNGGGGDVTWDSGNFSSNDYAAAEDSETVANIDQWNTFDIPIMTGIWVNNDATNFGFAVVPGADDLAGYYSQENATAANRHYLTVTYTVPVLITSITPSSGALAGGTSVTIAGSGFLDAQGSGTAKIDGTALTSYDSWADTQIVGTTPAGNVGAKDLVVTNDHAETDTLAGGYTYLAPWSGGARGRGRDWR